MKILDDHGRLWGKINLLDLFLVLSAAALLLSIASYLFFPQATTQLILQEARWKWYEIDVNASTPLIHDRMAPGDSQKNPDGEVFARVVAVNRREDGSLKATVRVRGKLWRTPVPMFGATPLKPGANFEFITERYVLQGIVVNVRELP